jgi:hypothetical protein
VKLLFEVTDNSFKIMLLNINYAGEGRELLTATVKLTEKSNLEEIILQLAKKQDYILLKDICFMFVSYNLLRVSSTWKF